MQRNFHLPLKGGGCERVSASGWGSTVRRFERKLHYPISAFIFSWFMPFIS